MFKHVILVLSILFLFGCSQGMQSKKTNAAVQSIDSLIVLSKTTSFSVSVRKGYVSEAEQHIESLKNDSLKARLLINTAYSNLLLGNFNAYGQSSKKALKYAVGGDDTIVLSRAYSYLGYFYHFTYKPDSSYYFYNKALQLFALKKDVENEGRMLLSMASAQERVRDYTGSEINSIKAISKLEEINEFQNLYLAYNLLAVNNKNLDNYSSALQNFEKAKEYLEKVKNNQTLFAVLYNNIGKLYTASGRYKIALQYFTKVLKIKDLLVVSPKVYAMALNNIAFVKFKLNDYSEIPALFYKALKIRDSLQIKDGIVNSYQSLAEYFISEQDSVKAIQYADQAKTISLEIKYNDGLLDAYKLLSKIVRGKEGKNYLNKYIELSDSLHQQERVVREKFTRIAYQTDEIIQKNEQVQKKNYLLTLALFVFLAFSILVYFLIRQRSKSKELEFAQTQDKANIEIYNLMLSQQKMFNEGSEKEKNRISRELHDGVLSRLFGARLSLDALNEGNSLTDIKEREKNIEELQSVEEEIRGISHNLNSSALNNETSFKVLVTELLAKQSKITNFEYELNFVKDIDWGEVSNTIKIHIYRILQEAIQNINKYSKAKKVKIKFTKMNDNLTISIEDNGVGFNVKTKDTGIGLKNIKSRVKDLNGKIDIKSEKNKGTLITIEVLLKDKFLKE